MEQRKLLFANFINSVSKEGLQAVQFYEFDVIKHLICLFDPTPFVFHDLFLISHCFLFRLELTMLYLCAIEIALEDKSFGIVIVRINKNFVNISCFKKQKDSDNVDDAASFKTKKREDFKEGYQNRALGFSPSKHTKNTN